MGCRRKRGRDPIELRGEDELVDGRAGLVDVAELTERLGHGAVRGETRGGRGDEAGVLTAMGCNMNVVIGLTPDGCILEQDGGLQQKTFDRAAATPPTLIAPKTWGCDPWW